MSIDISQEVCSLEHAKRLKELGLKQESKYSYILSEGGMINGEPYINKIMLTNGNIFKSPHQWSAFTTDELEKILVVHKILVIHNDSLTFLVERLIDVIEKDSLLSEWKEK